MNSFNKAIFQGTIVSIRGNESAGSITIAAPITIRTRRNGKYEYYVKETYPTLSYSKTTETENIINDFAVGDHVNIEAHLNSYIRMDQNSGDTREILNIYIDKIEHVNSCMEQVFGVEGRFYPDPVNEAYLSGELVGITKRPNGSTVFRINASAEEGRRNSINIVYYNAPAEFVNNLNIGDHVNIFASIQTVDTKENKIIRDYQRVVVHEMNKAEE